MKCPSCGHQWTTTKAKPVTIRATVGTDDKALFAYYKVTAPQEDLRFIARCLDATNPPVAFQFRELADRLEASTASPAARLREAWAVIDAFKAETIYLRQNPEAVFWAWVASQTDDRLGRNIGR